MSVQALATAVQHHREGNLRRAEEIYREILASDPGNADALHLLGLVAHQTGDNATAIGLISQAVQLKPDYPEALKNLGVALKASGRLDDAVASYREAVRWRPSFAEAHYNLGNALMSQGKPDEALTCFQEAVRLQPGFVDAHINLGNALMAQRKVNEAIAWFQHATGQQPNDANAHNNLGIAWLVSGNFQQGWPEYEWRLRCPGLPPPRPFSQSRWDGSPLSGRTILLHAEQGLGDTLQFVRYAPLVKERGGVVIVESQAALVPLLSKCRGIDRLVARDSPLPDFHTHASLNSLPGIFRTSLETVPADVPYLFADPDLIQRWRDKLDGVAGFRVGVVWHGSPLLPQYNVQRSLPLGAFAKLALIPGVRLVSLQVGEELEQLRAAELGFPIIDVGSDSHPFADTAAVMKNLDLVISIDSAMAHLAGGLGTGIWLLLPFAGDWRWLLDREDSPWYPTMRLFRQKRRGDWAEVFERIGAELAGLIDS